MVDATARETRSTTWLAGLGYDALVEDTGPRRYRLRHREYRRKPLSSRFAGILTPTPMYPGAWRGDVADGGDRWIVT